MRSQSFPLEESQSKSSQSGRSQPLNEHYARIESENKQLRKQLADYETAYSSSQNKLAELKAQDLTDVKEHVLAAILMRYLFDEILNRPLSILLKEEEEGLLNGIYENMATMEPPKGKLSHFSCVGGSANDMPIIRFANEAYLEK